MILLPGETVLSVWARRFLTIPLYLATLSLLSLTLPLWCLLFWSLDRWNKAPLLPRTRCFFFLYLYLLAECCGLALATLWWLIFSWGSPHRYRQLNYRLQGRWASAIFWLARRIFEMQVEVEGQEVARKGPFFLLVRHTSLADTVLAASFISDPFGIGLRYVLKKELLWDPCLDVVGRRLPNHFVDRSGQHRDRELESVRQLARDLPSDEGVLIYPEGTRFSERKKQRALQRLEDGGLLHLAAQARSWHHVLPPRPAGVTALLEERPEIDVVFLLHTGLEGASRWRDFWGGALIRKRLHLKLVRVAAEEIPAEGIPDWLFSRWAEVNDWVEGHYEP